MPDKDLSNANSYRFLDFFAGSGLVSEGAKPFFETVWANDICPKKASVYRENQHPATFRLGPIEKITGREIPEADVSWASFPCQDLSLAGKIKGIDAPRSGLVWHWLRIMDEMDNPPPILAVENVTGLISANGGAHYRALHNQLVKRGYRVGPMVINASKWVPQSRPRVFIISVNKKVNINGLRSKKPSWLHTKSLIKAVKNLKNLVWWKLPEPPERKTSLSDIIDFDAPCHDSSTAERTIKLIPKKHWDRLLQEKKNGLKVAPGYKRIRNSRQVLELRFDGIAGCLRFPKGGSSRQFVVLNKDNRFTTRLLTVGEVAGLMGAPDYKLPEAYNEGYGAMGDAVAVPVVKYLAKHLLHPLAKRAYDAT